MLHGADVLYVIEERAPGRPSLVTDVGVRLPAQLTASGLAMLAALPAAQVRALFPSQDRDGPARRPRPAVADRAPAPSPRPAAAASPSRTACVTAGFASVAAAVLDHTGHPVAAVALTFPDDAAPDTPTQSDLADHVTRAAASIARGLAGRRA